jgi:hypothetical protein
MHPFLCSLVTAESSRCSDGVHKLLGERIFFQALMIGNIIPEDVNFGLSPEHGYLLQRYGKYYSSLFNKHGQSVPSPIPVCLPSLMCVLLLSTEVE